MFSPSLFLIIFSFSYLGFTLLSSTRRGNSRLAQIPSLESSYFMDQESELTKDFDTEKYVKTAVTGNSINWYEIAGSGSKDSKDGLMAHYTKIRVPLLYGNDADKYGIRSQQVRNSFFELHLRKYQWGPLDPSKPIKHVFFVSGGPGESGQTWINKLDKLSRQYRRKNVIFYISDHRGIFESKEVVQLVDRKETDGPTHSHRISWRRISRNRSDLIESSWIHKVRDFEQEVGYPLVAMSCSNASRDLVILSLVIAKFNKIQNNPSLNNLYYIHAQSYGTQVAVRALILLPDFYDAVLLEGLASMELVRESGKSDFGILKACSDDRFCSRQMRRNLGSDSDTETGDLAKNQNRIHKSRLLPLSSPFDLKNLMEQMTSSSHNAHCRKHFHDQFTRHVYSDRYTFHDCLNLALYELLADDFVNPYSGKHGKFYPGMLTLPLIRDMYYCDDFERFKRQVTKTIEVIAMSVRGLNTPYVKSRTTKSNDQKEENDFNIYTNNTIENKQKHPDIHLHNSDFVQSYINLHEAFDMAGMERKAESSYCTEAEPRRDLVNQCQIYREQVHKLKKLKEMTGLRDKFDQNFNLDLEEVRKGKATTGSVVFEFDSKQRERKILEFTMKKGDDGSSNSESEEDDTFRTKSSESDSDEDDVVIVEANILDGKIKRVRDHRDYHNNNNTNNNNNNNKKKHKKKKKKGSDNHRNVKRYNAKWLKNKGHKYRNQIAFNDDELKSKMMKPEPAILPALKTEIKKSQQKFKRKYYYEVDNLSYSHPSTTKTRIFVVVGTLDVKTPLLTALQQFEQFKTPFKKFFELEKVAHSTEHCRTEIIRAYMAIGDVEQRGSLQIAHRCVNELNTHRTLDWEFNETVNLERSDWWV